MTINYFFYKLLCPAVSVREIIPRAVGTSGYLKQCVASVVFINSSDYS